MKRDSPCVQVIGLGITLLLVNCAQPPSSLDDVPPPPSPTAEERQPEQPVTQQSEAGQPEQPVTQQSEARQPEQPVTQQSEARRPSPSFQEFRKGLRRPSRSPIRVPPEPVVVEEAAPPLIKVTPSESAEERLADLIPEPEPESIPEPKPESQGWGSEEYYIDGLNHYNRENYDSAINSFNQALNLGAKDPDAVHNHLGLAYYQQKKFDQAIEQYTAALEINDKFAEVYLNRADVYFELRDYQKATADYQKWEGLNSK